MKTHIIFMALIFLIIGAFCQSIYSAERSSKWPRVKNIYLKTHPTCAACGKKTDLEVHHIVAFHIHPELELTVDNFITLCRLHHFTVGHDMDGPGPQKPSWMTNNPNVRKDAENMLKLYNGVLIMGQPSL